MPERGASVVLSGVRQELGSAAFLDANFVIDAFIDSASLHGAARDLLIELAAHARQGRIRLCLSTRVIDEVLWASRIVLVRRDHGQAAWAGMGADERADAWLRYSEEIAYLGRLLLAPDAPWEVLSVTAEDAGLAIEAIERHGLQPADAFHYAVCRRACDSCIVTNDRHFRGLSELNCIRYDTGQ